MRPWHPLLKIAVATIVAFIVAVRQATVSE
jgi:hypothetical protein